MEKTGLVLSGGGAKGAYQVGIMRALLEMNIPIDMISGASIGALNGAVLASAPNLTIGTERLTTLWHKLYETQPLQLNLKNKEKVFQIITYLTFLVSSGLKVTTPVGKIVSIAAWAKDNSKIQSLLNKQSISLLGVPLSHLFSPSQDSNALLTDEVLLSIMNEFLDIEQLQQSIPLYVSIFPQQNFFSSALEILGAELLGIENAPSQFKKIQSLAIEEQKEMLLASAAIPLLFSAKQDKNGNFWSDGGQGGWIKSQGNTPITPLIHAGCKYVIVSHLSNGSLWHRHDFPNTICIEIRPNPKINMGFRKIFDFSKENILNLMEFGYQDTMHSIKPIYEMISGLQKKDIAISSMKNNLNHLQKTELEMDNAINRLRINK